MITVVSVKGLNRPEQRQAVCYVGRSFAGWPASPLGNPFRDPDAVGRFSDWLKDHPQRNKLLADLWEACGRGARPIGCWCLSEPWKANRTDVRICHAQEVAVQLLDMVESGQLPAAMNSEASSRNRRPTRQV